MPTIKGASLKSETINQFSGLNRKTVIGENEFADMLNMTPDDFPTITAREPRKRVTLPSGYGQLVGCACMGDNAYFLLYDNLNLYIAKYSFETSSFFERVLVCAGGDEERTVVKMGAKIIVFPDKKIINTAVTDNAGNLTTNSVESMEYTDTYSSFDISDENGTVFTSPTFSAAEPTAANGAVWFDTSVYPPVCRRYSSATLSWHEIQTYIKIDNIPMHHFDNGDSVGVSVSSDCIYTDGNSRFAVNLIEGTNTETILIPMKFTAAPGTYTSVTLSGTIPDFDYITECNNRLWACKYGKNSDGVFVNEIYASKLGNPKSWYYFANTAEDSYYMSLGNAGEFTGAATYQSNPVFFRNDCVHRIYGSSPSSFQLVTTSGYGVRKGSHKTIAVMNDTMYYLSSHGVMAYKGGLPVCVSEQFGADTYENGTAGVCGHKYYLDMTQDDYSLDYTLVYDDYYKAWYKESSAYPKYFIERNNECYAVNPGYILTALGDSSLGASASQEARISFDLTFGKQGYHTPDRKSVNKIILKIKLYTSSYCTVKIAYDDVAFHTIAELEYSSSNPEPFTVPLIPRRCDHYQIKLEGKGKMKLISMTKVLEEYTEYV